MAGDYFKQVLKHYSQVLTAMVPSNHQRQSEAPMMYGKILFVCIEDDADSDPFHTVL
jgi:hypothetical protein